jgi:hypothetical protein
MITFACIVVRPYTYQEVGRQPSTICKKHIQIDIANEHSIEPVGVGRESKAGMREAT